MFRVPRIKAESEQMYTRTSRLSVRIKSNVFNANLIYQKSKSDLHFSSTLLTTIYLKLLM